MGVAEWRETPGGFRYVVTDYRDATEEERYEVFRTGAELVAATGRRTGLLVVGGDEGIDPSWFKSVKDHNSTARDDHVRVALVGLGRRGPSIAGLLNVRVSHERTRAFDDEAAALAWLEESV